MFAARWDIGHRHLRADANGLGYRSPAFLSKFASRAFKFSAPIPPPPWLLESLDEMKHLRPPPRTATLLSAYAPSLLISPLPMPLFSPSSIYLYILRPLAA